MRRTVRVRPRAAAVTALVTTLLAALALLGACGLPQSSSPVQVPPAEVPYGLLDATATASATPTATPGVLLAAWHDLPRRRAAAARGGAASRYRTPRPSRCCRACSNRLAVGPSDRERARGLVTDLGPASTIVVRSISAGTASIDLQSTSQDPSASKLPVAIGQIVLTATSIVGVDRVVFVRSGSRLPVPGPSGGGYDRGRPRRSRLRPTCWRPDSHPSTAPSRCPDR